MRAFQPLPWQSSTEMSFPCPLSSILAPPPHTKCIIAGAGAVASAPRPRPFLTRIWPQRLERKGKGLQHEAQMPATLLRFSGPQCMRLTSMRPPCPRMTAWRASLRTLLGVACRWRRRGGTHAANHLRLCAAYGDLAPPPRMGDIWAVRMERVKALLPGSPH